MSEPLLRIEGISKEYSGTRVLHDIHFSLHKGQILGLVGENGAGKSTLMKILFGMPVIHETGGYDGKIFLEGKEVSFNNPFLALESGIGMVHQEFSLIPGFSITENILLNTESTKNNFLTEIFGDRLATLDREEMGKRAQEAIEKLGVQLDKDMLIAEIPVGYKQFTEISRELDRRNLKLLVLDEPTAVLCESEAQVLLKSMRHFAEKGIAIIFISHRLQEIIEVTDNVLVLCDGKRVKECKTKETTIDQIAEWMVGRTATTKGKDQRKLRSLSKEVVLEVENLWVDMPGELVRRVSFNVLKGEIFGIGGLAGQGKLGIPNGIMGYFPAGGSVRFKGKKIPHNKPRNALDANLCFVSEDRKGVGLLLDEPMDQNIVFTSMQTQDKFLKHLLGGLIKWRDEKAIYTIAQKYIRELGIKCVSEKQKVKELSGGNQQKVCLAKAFCVNPELLFVSEPTRGIDIGAKRIVLDTLQKHNEEEGITIVVVSSELEELRSICHRIAIVNEGQISGILPAETDSKEFGKLMAGLEEPCKD